MITKSVLLAKKWVAFRLHQSFILIFVLLSRGDNLGHDISNYVKFIWTNFSHKNKKPESLLLITEQKIWLYSSVKKSKIFYFNFFAKHLIFIASILSLCYDCDTYKLCIYASSTTPPKFESPLSFESLQDSMNIWFSNG